MVVLFYSVSLYSRFFYCDSKIWLILIGLSRFGHIETIKDVAIPPRHIWRYIVFSNLNYIGNAELRYFYGDGNSDVKRLSPRPGIEPGSLT